MSHLINHWNCACGSRKKNTRILFYSILFYIDLSLIKIDQRLQFLPHHNSLPCHFCPICLGTFVFQQHTVQRICLRSFVLILQDLDPIWPRNYCIEYIWLIQKKEKKKNIAITNQGNKNEKRLEKKLTSFFAKLLIAFVLPGCTIIKLILIVILCS